MFEAVVAQVQILRRLGATPVVLGVEDDAASQDSWRLEGAELHLARRRGPVALAYSPDLPRLLDAAKLDLLHLHGIWQYPVRAAGTWAGSTGKPMIVSPHGMLDPWITNHNAWKKQAARLLWERTAWSRASLLHALTEAEAADIEREIPTASTIVIPNAAPAATKDPPPPRGPVALYLGRIHEKKNLGALIAAWTRVRGDLPAESSLVIAGWGDDEGIAALESALSGSAATNVEFVGTAFGSQKAALLDLARFMVLPSHSEGLPMAILEGWAAGVPSIMSDACNLPEGFASGAAIRCGTSNDAIGAALVEAFAKTGSQWKEMSNSALALASGPFSQETIAKHWERSYGRLL